MIFPAFLNLSFRLIDTMFCWTCFPSNSTKGQHRSYTGQIICENADFLQLTGSSSALKQSTTVTYTKLKSVGFSNQE